MVPIQDVLHRIQWDPAWRGSFFELGYVDRIAGALVRVPLAGVRLDAGMPPALSLRDAGGAVLHIPLHRVRRVWRDGVICWERRGGDPLQCAHGVDSFD
jgi:uncharacterized protein (UPF0248 family)